MSERFEMLTRTVDANQMILNLEQLISRIKSHGQKASFSVDCGFSSLAPTKITDKPPKPDLITYTVIERLEV